MGNRNTEVRYDDWVQQLAFILEQFRKTLNTALPGVIHEYDPLTNPRRARVQPAIDALMTAEMGGGRVAQPVIVDVPVLHAGGGDTMAHAPIRRGDLVKLLFSQRGLEEFKRTLDVAGPSADSVMALRDAVAIVGVFGPLEGFMPASTTGYSVQSLNGATHVVVEPDGRVLITAPGDLIIRGNTDQVGNTDQRGNVMITGNVTVTGNISAGTGADGGRMSVNGPLDATGEVTGRGVQLSTHTHGGVDRGGANTNPPN